MKKRTYMNLAQPLNSFEKKLQSFSAFEKVQLYLIPIIIAIFIVYNFLDLKKVTEPNSVSVLEKNELDTYVFLKQLQEFVQNQNLTLQNIKQNGLKFSVEIEGEFLNILQFILFCEHYKSVNTVYGFKLSSKELKKTLLLDFELANNKYEAHEYEKLLTLIVALQNPFKQQTSTYNETLKINAIVNNEVLINDIWLKQGDSFFVDKVLEIHRHYIILEKPNGEQYVLHLMKE